MSCILIVSQYYKDIQGFVVKDKTTTEETWKKFLCDIEDYKRDEDCMRKYHFGDFEGFEDLDCRHNVNDISGDIYVIHCSSVGVAFEWLEEIKENNKGFNSKRFQEEISKHHDRNKLEDIIDRHFELL